MHVFTNENVIKLLRPQFYDKNEKLNSLFSHCSKYTYPVTTSTIPHPLAQKKT